MGNEDGLIQAIEKMGTNTTIEFKGGYFSFAFNNEIALVLPHTKKSNPYWILNCDEKLWRDVKKKVKETKQSKQKIIQFWKKMSEIYEINGYSHDFKDL